MNKRLVAVAFLSTVALAGCTGNTVRHTLGLERNNPDEFQVVSRPPLNVPPIYYLRPPTDTAEGVSPAEAKAAAILQDRAVNTENAMQSGGNSGYMPDTAVVGVGESSLGSAGESSLLNAAGAEKAQTNIREELKAETTPPLEKPADQKSWSDKLNPFKKAKKADETTVDAAKEQERLKKNREEGKPVTEGDVPNEPAPSILDKVF